jgi:hypothetical protein
LLLALFSYRVSCFCLDWPQAVILLLPPPE